MLYELTGICQRCATEITVILHNGQLLESCSNCSELPFGVKKYPGLVYVISNPSQRGVKIGHTTKTVEQRIKTLNSPGVVGRFEPIAIFPSDKPKKDEKKVHEKLTKHNIEREHFDLSGVEASLKVFRTLNRRKPIFYDQDVEETFHLRLEEDRIKMKLRLKGKSNGNI